jgi:hypothetical protein
MQGIFHNDSVAAKGKTWINKKGLRREPQAFQEKRIVLFMQ